LNSGYIGDVGEASTAFIDNPPWLLHFRPQGGRTYATGDMVVHNPDGSVSIVGRKDNQTKIRGVRVELGEIEHQIQSHFPQAHDVVVERVSSKKRPLDHFLAAFVLQRGARDNSLNSEQDSIFVEVSNAFHAELARAQAILLDHLPAYMIPSLFLPVSLFLLLPVSTCNIRAERVALIPKHY
jgi:acyl-coenzyme A synthetase/AMP-(fatty) acid ligase